VEVTWRSPPSADFTRACLTFRATGITDYLTKGGRIQVAQRMAGHSNAKTTGFYDRRNDDISMDEVERIGIAQDDS
jgi:integrase/recombinase XerD